MTTSFRPGSAAFVALIAGVLTVTAATIDMNLPAIPATAAELGGGTGAKLTVPLFFLGLALAQAVTGPLSDRYGRKPVLLAGLAGFVLATLACALAPTLEALLAARFVQGIFAAVGPVLGRAIVRDLFEGPEMARVMSFVMAAFILAPMIAPSIGAVILLFGGWRWIFLFLALYGAALLWLSASRLEESLVDKNPRALEPARLAASWRDFFADRRSRVHAAVITLVMAVLLTYLTTAAPIFMDAMGLNPQEFGLLFAFVAAFAAAGSLGNAKLVRLTTLRRLIASGLALALAASLAGLALQLTGLASVWTLAPVFALFFLSFGPIVTNATTLALEPHGTGVGAAASVLGVVQSVVPAAIATGVGLAFDGTALPTLLAMLALTGTALVLALCDGAREPQTAEVNP